MRVGREFPHTSNGKRVCLLYDVLPLWTRQEKNIWNNDAQQIIAKISLDLILSALMHVADMKATKCFEGVP